MSKTKRIIMAVCLVIGVAVLILFSVQNPGTVGEEYMPGIYATVWSLLPPVVAIALALITKEAYSSLFIGILTGALLYSNGNLELMMNTMFFHEDGGMVTKLADSWNVGILVFLVVLGILVALMNRVGGSAAFGQWASEHIKTRVGAQLATMVLGVLIFVDDYFNCLTVGSVMRPVTDRHKVSRAKLAYLIDATAAPVCIIAPISSWAAAVTSSVPEDSTINGFAMFLSTIPYNYYAILTLIMIIFLCVTKMDYGPMRTHEKNALAGDLFTTAARPYGEADEENVSTKGKVIDLVFPVIILIASCVFGMVYTGGFFSGTDFITAFSGCDASMGLVIGSFITLIVTFFYYMLRGVMKFQDFAACIPEGFKAMVAPILILTLACTLSGMTGLLGAKFFVADLVAGATTGLALPAELMYAIILVIIFAVAAFLAFATGTSWGTFGILIPIVCNLFATPDTQQMLVIAIAACLAGSVCGDHCSPISDTTIMASAGAHSDHVNHVSTQLPYAMTVAGVCLVSYFIAALVQNVWISLAIAVVLMIATLAVIRNLTLRKEKVG